MAYQWGTKSKERMEGVWPLAAECATKALSYSQFDMTIPHLGGMRTAEEQAEIHSRGASHKDGYIKLSRHQIWPGDDFCYALDVWPVGITMQTLDDVVTRKIPVTPKFNHFAQCMFTAWQEIIQGNNLNVIMQWGGHWKTFRDVPHWQWIRV